MCQQQRAKLAQAQNWAGEVPVVAFSHSYGPLDDVVERFNLELDYSLQPGASRQVWLNRYGYLSDAKFAALAPLIQRARSSRQYPVKPG
jgi:hypothetical protein